MTMRSLSISRRTLGAMVLLARGTHLLGFWTCPAPWIKRTHRRLVVVISHQKRSCAYAFVTDHYSLAGCQSEIISSATVEGVEQITEFLKTSPLHTFPNYGD